MKYLEPKFTVGYTGATRKNWDKIFKPKCDRCGEILNEEKCKLRCPNCGFTRDCSDP